MSAFLDSPSDRLPMPDRSKRSAGFSGERDDDEQEIDPAYEPELDFNRRVFGWESPDEEEESRQLNPMKKEDVQQAMHVFVSDAINFCDQELQPFRAAATRYYKGEPFGNEEQGRSQVVITELRDTVLMILPSLMRIFFGAERAIEYTPRNAGQEEAANQLTEYVWDVVVNEDNEGFVNFYSWFKDALVKRLGAMKYWYDDETEVVTYEAHYVPVDKLLELEADPAVEILEIEPCDGLDPHAALYDVEYRHTRKEGRIRFKCIPPEEFLFTKGSRVLTASQWVPGVAPFVGHRTELTKSQLLALGVSQKDIDQYAQFDSSLRHAEEEIARQSLVTSDVADIGPVATQKSLYIEAYPFLDVDGDGIAELRRVVMLGPGFNVIENEPCARRPFAVLTPDPEPHTIIGQGVCDWTMDLQKMNSSIWRSMLDSLALSIHPRMGYVEGEVSLSDVLNTQVGAPIRMRSPQALVPLAHDFVGREALIILDKTMEIKENRSGITKASAGLDADAMQSTTKAAAAATITAAQAHVEMIARVFAETGIKTLFKGLLQLVVENPPVERLIRMRSTYIPIRPDTWDANLDVSVKVAIGAGLDDDKYAALMDTREEMKFILQTFGVSNPLVTLKQYRDTNVKMLRLRGRMDADNFFQDVDPNWQPPQQEQQPDPNLIYAQAEMQKAEAKTAEVQASAQLEAQSQKIHYEQQIAELQLKVAKMESDITLAREKSALDAQTAITVAQINKQAEMQQAALDAALRKMEMLVNAVKTPQVESPNSGE